MTVYGGTGPLVLGITSAEAVVGVILVVLRGIYARVHEGRLRKDFLIVAFATACAIMAQVAVLVACIHGLGNHFDVVGFDNMWQILKMTWFGLSIGITGATFGKLAIIALLLHITPAHQRKRRTLLWTVAGSLALVNFVQIPLILTQCQPFTYLWHRAGKGSCPHSVSTERYSLFQGSVAIAVDLFLAAYPITVVWGLNMNKSVKIAFCTLMAGGFLPATAALLRVTHSNRLLSTTDPSYDVAPYLLWATTEMWFVIILGSVPPLRPLFERFFKSTAEVISSGSHHMDRSQSMKLSPKVNESYRTSRSSVLPADSHIMVTRVTEVVGGERENSISINPFA